MILDLFIYIIQFYINQNTFLPGFIIRKELQKGPEQVNVVQVQYELQYVLKLIPHFKLL